MGSHLGCYKSKIVKVEFNLAPLKFNLLLYTFLRTFLVTTKLKWTEQNLKKTSEFNSEIHQNIPLFLSYLKTFK